MMNFTNVRVLSYLHNQPRKKLWTFLILTMSGFSSSCSCPLNLQLKIIRFSLNIPHPHRSLSKGWCLCGRSFPSFFKVSSCNIVFVCLSHCQPALAQLTSSLSFLISTVRSWQCLVYCHLAVFSLSTTCRRWRCFCSNCSFCSNSLLKLQHLQWYSVGQSHPPALPRPLDGLNPLNTLRNGVGRQQVLSHLLYPVDDGEAQLKHSAGRIISGEGSQSTTLSSAPSLCLLAPLSGVTRRSQ